MFYECALNLFQQGLKFLRVLLSILFGVSIGYVCVSLLTTNNNRQTYACLVFRTSDYKLHVSANWICLYYYLVFVCALSRTIPWRLPTILVQMFSQ